MNKKEYLEELRKELISNNAEDIDDIISEYSDHFDFKLEEGYTEEEIAKKLSSPEEIVEEYKSDKPPVNKSVKGLKITGLTLLSIPAALVYAIIWLSVIVIGAFSAASLVTGFCLITTINIGGLIPYMPYLSSLLLGIALFGLSALAGVGTFYIFKYVCQWGKTYVKWCKNVASGTTFVSVGKHPSVSKKTTSKLKLIAIVGLICFVSAFIAGFVSMYAYSGSASPWHVWHWFE